jgi:hypothetical protein
VKAASRSAVGQSRILADILSHSDAASSGDAVVAAAAAAPPPIPVSSDRTLLEQATVRSCRARPCAFITRACVYNRA